MNIFFNFSPFNSRSALHSLLFKRSERGGARGKKNMVYFNLSYRFSSVFSMSIPLFSRSENAHFRTLSLPDFFLPNTQSTTVLV